MFATQEKQQLILIGPLRILFVSALIVEIIDPIKYNMNIVYVYKDMLKW